MKAEKYSKTKAKKYTRRSKVTSVNLEAYQLELLHEKNLNISYVLRDLLDDFLKVNFPKEFEEAKTKKTIHERSEDNESDN